MSASLLSRLEVPIKQLSCSSSSFQMARQEFQTHVASGDIERTSKFIEVYWQVVGVPGPGLPLEWCLVIDCSRSPKQLLVFYAILDSAFPEVFGAL